MVLENYIPEVYLFFIITANWSMGIKFVLNLLYTRITVQDVRSQENEKCKGNVLMMGLDTLFYKSRNTL